MPAIKLNEDFDKNADATRLKALKYATETMRETGRYVDAATLEKIARIKRELDESEAKVLNESKPHRVNNTAEG